MAVGTAVLAIVVAIVVVLVVLLATRWVRAGQPHAETLSPADQASERTERQRARDVARDEREDAAGEQ